MFKKIALVATVAALTSTSAFAGENEAKKWINDEFQPSSLSQADQMKEMEWFINAAKPFKGMEINRIQGTDQSL
jgi:glycerol transport system substrate-binding protein